MTEQTSPEVRAARLAEFNAVLAERNLSGLVTVGDHTLGQIELTGINEILDAAKRFFTDIRFSCLFPGGGAGEYTVRFNANSALSPGTVVVTVINGRIAMVRQHRITLGRRISEVPRAFGLEMAEALRSGTLADLEIDELKPLKVVFDELTPEIMNTLSRYAVYSLGNLAENSGTHAVEPEYFLVILEVDEAVLRASKNIEAGLKNRARPEDAFEPERGIKLQLVGYAAAKRLAVDNHSIAALYKFDDEIRRILAENEIELRP